MTDFEATYRDRLNKGGIQADFAQEEAIDVFAKLNMRLQGYFPRPPSLLRNILKPPKAPPLGLYLYGDVGRGKSMLMDLFFETVAITQKRRVHFHQFMLEIHRRLFELQNEGSQDIVSQVAQEIAHEAWLLCFDEFHVDNIADAMILGRLFDGLFKAGVVVISTSNWAPEDLYKNGLQRERFLPFIDLILKKMQVYKLDGHIDHRLEKTRNLATIFYPLSHENTKKLQNIFFQLNGNAEPEELILHVQGRSLRLTHTSKGIGFFNFDELCVQPLGAADYLALALCLHTLLIDGIPRLRDDKRDETTRFINLIDALYEAKVKVFLACEVPVEKLAPSGELGPVFQRTLSRLIEMQSVEYKKLPHRLN